MIATLTLLAALQQLAPVMEPGVNAPFAQTCLKVEELLSQGQWQAALKVASVLPSTSAKIEWDDSAVPAPRRAELRKAAEEALAAWTRGKPGTTFTFAKPGNIKFSFTETLPPNADTAEPAGAVHLFSDDPAEPRLEAVIALKRGAAATDTEYPDVHNEVGYALVAFMGIQRSPIPGTFAYRTEASVMGTTRPLPAEFMLARRNVELADKLRKAAKDKVRMTPARPQLSLEPFAITLPPAVQGDVLKFSVLMSNQGNAPLTLRIRPDCGCLTGSFPSVIQPGGSGIIQGQVDTHEFVGSLHKQFLIFSNDADFPLRTVSVRVQVTPKYRLIVPSGRNALLEAGKSKEIDVFLSLGPGVEASPVEATVEGVPAAVAWEAWSGKLTDTELGETERDHRGYRFRLRFQPQTTAGRNASTLLVRTDDPKFPTIRTTVYTQSGIIALPERVYFGEVPKEPRRGLFILSRPGKPFKVTKMETSSSKLKVEISGTPKDDEVRLAVQMDGTADYGLFNAVVTVYTDDPLQPTVLVPVEAVIR